MSAPSLDTSRCLLLVVPLLFLVAPTRAGSTSGAVCKDTKLLQDAAPLQDTMSLVQARLSVSRSVHTRERDASAPSEHDTQTPEGWDWTAGLKSAVTAAETYSQKQDLQDAQPVELAAAAAPEDNFVALPSSLQIRDVVNGTGKGVAKGQRVWVHYTANLDDGTEFDNSYDGEPMEVEVGHGDVVAGFDEGLLNMRLGGKRKIIIPPSLGYGSEPPPGSPIPANANLHFTIEMMMIDPGNVEGNDMDSAAVATPSAPQPTFTPGTPEAALAKVPSKAEATERFSNAISKLYQPDGSETEASPGAPEPTYAPGTPEAALAKVPSKAEATERFSNAVLKLYMPKPNAQAGAAAAAPAQGANPQQNRAEAALAKIPSKEVATEGFAKQIAKLYMPSAGLQIQQAQMAPKSAQEAAAQAEMRMNPQDGAIYSLAEFRQEFLSEDMTLPDVDAWFYKHCEPISKDLASMRFA